MKSIIFKIIEVILIILYITTLFTDRNGLPLLVCALYAYHIAEEGKLPKNRDLHRREE
jgi:hypothetical protein